MKKAPKKHEGERNIYIDDCAFISIAVPGPGSYNPSLILPQIKVNSTTPQQMIKRHQELEQKTIKRIQSISPIPGKYDPQNIAIQTFDSIRKKFLIERSTENSKIKSKFFGMAERFKNKKKKQDQAIVGPGSYELGINWPGKLSNSDDKEFKKNWTKLISKGVKKSIYY